MEMLTGQQPAHEVIMPRLYIFTQHVLICHSFRQQWRPQSPFSPPLSDCVSLFSNHPSLGTSFGPFTLFALYSPFMKLSCPFLSYLAGRDGGKGNVHAELLLLLIRLRTHESELRMCGSLQRRAANECLSWLDLRDKETHKSSCLPVPQQTRKFADFQPFK